MPLVFTLLTMQIQELLTCFRILVATPYRGALLSQVDKLLDENVLLGPSFGSREALR